MSTSLRRRELFGFRFIDAPSVTPVVEALLNGGSPDPEIDAPVPLVFTPNVDLLVHLDRNDSPRTTALVRRAAYVLADGQPVVWASRLLGRPLATRLAGSTLVAELWPRVVSERRSVLVIAASDELAEMVRIEYPKARVVVPPYFHADDDDAIAAIVDECLTVCAGEPPELVLAGLSYPKQYTMLDELISCWPAESSPNAYLAVGASLEMYYGLRARAPEWVQRIGMEWLYRFAQEPRRLFRRYFVDDLEFARIVWRERRAIALAEARAGREIGQVLPGPWPRRRFRDDREHGEAS